eukprot:4313956-Alexandrium_andersonii.AAC.1
MSRNSIEASMVSSNCLNTLWSIQNMLINSPRNLSEHVDEFAEFQGRSTAERRGWSFILRIRRARGRARGRSQGVRRRFRGIR